MYWLFFPWMHFEVRDSTKLRRRRRPVGKLLLNCCSLIHVWKCRGPPLSIQFSPRSVALWMIQCKSTPISQKKTYEIIQLLTKKAFYTFDFFSRDHFKLGWKLSWLRNYSIQNSNVYYQVAERRCMEIYTLLQKYHHFFLA